MMRYIFACLLTITVGAFAGVAVAKATPIAGSWAGGGSVKLTSGQVEKVRCRIRYEKGSGRTVVLYVRCAHSNGTFQVSGRVVKLSKSFYSGRLYSEQYGTAGDVGISVSGNRQTVKAKSSKGTATVILTKQ
ncbi:hypothetical protein BMS3Bbin10_02304 [bacterium BMS3Bbin10]|nr:hypothetical protein BMS3Bbin10_02304 [bacterium BMS3Bbin10]